MIEFAGLNIFAILVAWVINVLVGTFWYSTAGFGKQWSKLSGVDLMKLPKKEANRAIGFVSVSSLLQAIALAVVLNSLHVQTAADGIFAALVLWFGFTAITTIGNTLYQRQSLTFWAINSLFFLVVMVANGAILATWN